jgi:hypothetical protein
MFKAIFIGGGFLTLTVYFVSKYTLKQLQAKQNPLAPFQ